MVPSIKTTLMGKAFNSKLLWFPFSDKIQKIVDPIFIHQIGITQSVIHEYEVGKRFGIYFEGIAKSIQGSLPV
jgi:hypothetical protein